MTSRGQSQPRQSPSPPARSTSPASVGGSAVRPRSSQSNLRSHQSPETVLASPGSSHSLMTRPQSRSPPPQTVSSNPASYFVPPAIAVPPPSSPSLSLNALTHSHAPHHGVSGSSTLSRPSSPPRSGTSSPARSIHSEPEGLFERDIEFSPAHILSAYRVDRHGLTHTGAHEAVDVAVPPILDEAAIAITTAPAIETETSTMRRTGSATSLLRHSLIAGGIGNRPAGLAEMTDEDDPHGATTAAERAVFPPSPPSPLSKKGWQSPTYTLALAQADGHPAAASPGSLLDPNSGSPRQPRRSLSPGTQRPSQIAFPTAAGNPATPSPLETPPADAVDPAIRRLSFMSYSDLISAFDELEGKLTHADMERGTTPLDLAAVAEVLPAPSASPPLAIKQQQRLAREASPLHA